MLSFSAIHLLLVRLLDQTVLVDSTGNATKKLLIKTYNASHAWLKSLLSSTDCVAMLQRIYGGLRGNAVKDCLFEIGRRWRHWATILFFCCAVFEIQNLLTVGQLERRPVYSDGDVIRYAKQDVPVITIYIKNCPSCSFEAPDAYASCISKFPPGCPTFLKVALLQAKEYNRNVILLGDGDECQEWAARSGITWQTVPIETINQVFCPMRAENETVLSLRRGEREWATAVARWFVLNKFAQGELPNQTIEAPERFNLIDHDFMTYVDSSMFFHRFGEDAEVAVCCHYPRCNGIYSLFTRKSIADIARWAYHHRDVDDMKMLLSYAKHGVPQNELECWSDNLVWPPGSTAQGNCGYSYDGIKSEVAKKEMPDPPAFPVINSCLPFPDGRILESIILDTEGIYESMRRGDHKIVDRSDTYHVVTLEKESNGIRLKPRHWQAGRALYYRKGHLHLKWKTNSSISSQRWVAASRQPFERALGAHFQGGYKNHMKLHFRPNMKSVKDQACKACLESDCDCENVACANCWNKCLPKCRVLQEFEIALGQRTAVLLVV